MVLKSALAIHGGPRVRAQPLPYRRLFGEHELEMVRRVFEDSWEGQVDFGFQGKFEGLYTQKFCELQGGGFADAVSSGTAALFLTLEAMELAEGSQVVISPVTDPGNVSAVIMAGLRPVVADSRPGSFNLGPEGLDRAVTPSVKAALLTHIGGQPVDMPAIMDVAKTRGMAVIEDCSQAHGATWDGVRIGCFGEMAAFSTMFTKNHATGGCGGVVYTRTEDRYWLARSHADRGKNYRDPEVNLRDPVGFLFPALNFNQDEVSCAIGISTLERLPQVMQKRIEIAQKIDAALEASETVSPCENNPRGVPSPYFHTVQVDVDRLKVSKTEFARAVAAEGITINPDYRYVVAEWGWTRPYLPAGTSTPNASDFRGRSFNISLNERYTDDDIGDIIDSILKVEKHYRR